MKGLRVLTIALFAASALMAGSASVVFATPTVDCSQDQADAAEASTANAADVNEGDQKISVGANTNEDGKQNDSDEKGVTAATSANGQCGSDEDGKSSDGKHDATTADAKQTAGSHTNDDHNDGEVAE